MDVRCWLSGATMTGVMCLIGGMCLAGGAEPKEDDQAPSYWMKKKLEYSNRILEGLAGQDYEAIGKSARSLSALNQIEKWVHGNTGEYRTQLRIFQNANEQVIRMADRENLDGAALAYVQLTLTCVNCHKVIRDSKSGK